MTRTDPLTLSVSGSPRSAGHRVAAALERLLARAAPLGRRTLVSAAVSIAPHDPIALYAAGRTLGQEPAIWLQPDRGFGLLAIGSAWMVEAEGSSRFGDIAAAWSELADGALVDSPDDVRGAGPLLFGGFAFGDEPTRSAVWRGFTGARLDLPRLLVTFTPGATWLTVSVVVGPCAEDRAAAWGATEEVARWWETLAAVSPISTDSRLVALRIVNEVPAAPAWRATAARLSGAVGRGRVDKVVLARRVDLVADEPIDIPGAIRRLEASAPESTIFAISRGARVMIGATPELLVGVDGWRFRTVAMAGSIRRGSDAAEDERLAALLLASEKDAEEHEIVVRMIRGALAPLADRVTIGSRPSVVRLRHVQHLATEVHGRLRERLGILALVQRLHPTPAVGGAPRELALQLIADEEWSERGWYAGPVGWLDRRGDGEFVVAIRSGVVAERTASIFAGCGILADSDPQSEWDESSIKLRTLFSALGRVES